MWSGRVEGVMAYTREVCAEGKGRKCRQETD
jgi:hypothetical protein